MCSDFAANAPEFFLHHAFLDFIWIRWQEKDPACKRAFYLERPMKLISSTFMIIDFIDSYNQGECCKVRYDDFLQRALKPGDYLGRCHGMIRIDCMGECLTYKGCALIA